MPSPHVSKSLSWGESWFFLCPFMSLSNDMSMTHPISTSYTLNSSFKPWLIYCSTNNIIFKKKTKTNKLRSSTHQRFSAFNVKTQFVMKACGGETLANKSDVRHGWLAMGMCMYPQTIHWSVQMTFANRKRCCILSF